MFEAKRAFSVKTLAETTKDENLREQIDLLTTSLR